MAEENKRKSSRSFDLGKKSTRSFDLRKDDDADEVKLPPASEPRQHDSDSQNGGGKKWLWIIMILIAIAVIAFFLFRGCGNGDDEAAVQPATPEPAEAVQSQPAPEAVSHEPGDATQPDSAQVPQSDAAAHTTVEAPAAEPAALAEPAKPAQPSAPARSSDGDIEAMALRVIRGDFGNNPDRRLKLGDDYQVIQNRVNELMRQ